MRSRDPVSTSALSAEVSRLLSTRWPFYAGRLRERTGGIDEVSIDRFARHGEMAARLAAFTRTRPGADVRGMASLWIQWYLVTAWPPVLAAALLLGRRPDPRPAASALVLDAEGKPEAIALDEFPAGTSAGPVSVLEALAFDQGALLIEQVSRAAGMAPRVAWSNATNVLGWFLEQADPIAAAGALDPAWRLLSRRRRPDGSPNPLHVPRAEHPSAGGRPCRRVCCLRYRLDDHPYCSDCPIPLRRRS